MKNILKTLIKKNKLHLFSAKKNICMTNTTKESQLSTKSFSYQWDKFRKTQLDSYTKTTLSYNRFKNTGWNLQKLKNKRVLEVGGGAGRFTEILQKADCYLFTIDSSSSIYVNFDNNNKNNKKTFFIQNNIENNIFKNNVFDYVFCYGVIQHTKDPFKTLDILISKLKISGKLSVDFYRKFKYPTWNSTPKYFWRPITKRVKIKILYQIIKFYIPIYLPIDTFLKKLFKKYSTVICGLIPIPCYNYYFTSLSSKLKIQWAILDTFDALTPKYDYPLTKKQIENHLKKFKNIDYTLHYGSNGIVLNLIKFN